MTDPLLNNGETYEEMRLWNEAKLAAAEAKIVRDAADLPGDVVEGEAPEVT